MTLSHHSGIYPRMMRWDILRCVRDDAYKVKVMSYCPRAYIEVLGYPTILGLDTMGDSSEGVNFHLLE